MVVAKAKNQKKMKNVRTKARAVKTYKSRVPQDVFGTNSKMVKMVWNSDFLIDSGANPTGNVFTSQKSFRINNVNLPFVGQTATGTLPNGYTQAAAAFKYFKVLGAKVKLVFYDASEDLQTGILITSSSDTTTLQAQTTNNADMFRYCYVKPLSPLGTGETIYSKYVKIHSLEGLTAKQLQGDFSLYSTEFNNSVAGALANINGTTGDLIRKRICQLHVAIAANVTQAAAVSCKCKLTVEYYTYCWGKNILPISNSAA